VSRGGCAPPACWCGCPQGRQGSCCEKYWKYICGFCQLGGRAHRCHSGRTCHDLQPYRFHIHHSGTGPCQHHQKVCRPHRSIPHQTQFHSQGWSTGSRQPAWQSTPGTPPLSQTVCQVCDWSHPHHDKICNCMACHSKAPLIHISSGNGCNPEGLGLTLGQQEQHKLLSFSHV